MKRQSPALRNIGIDIAPGALAERLAVLSAMMAVEDRSMKHGGHDNLMMSLSSGLIDRAGYDGELERCS